MSRLVEIEAKPVGNMVIVRVEGSHGEMPLYLASGAYLASGTFYVHTPADARELSQQLRGAADALLDWALTREQPQNFAAAEDGYFPVNGAGA